jgi:HEAT repeat protein/predicted negative regulator of RcsB-dependent stress response
LRTLGGLFPAGDPAWDTELRRFLEDAVTDAETSEDLALFEAAALERARTLLVSMDREGARGVLSSALERARAFQVQGLLVELRLALVGLCTDLGEHDEAEDLLRQFRGHPDLDLQARCNLALGRIAVMRQEPWAEDILAAAYGDLQDSGDRARAVLLLGERHLRHQRPDDAKAAFYRADALAVSAGLGELQAAVCVGLGDSAWALGDIDGAVKAWNAGRARAQEAGAEEVLLRIRVREGDMLVAQGDPASAASAYQEAVEGYRALQLTLRQAWAQLRVSRVTGDPGPAEQAWEIFASSDVAVGIGAADAVLGDSTRSLNWHMARSAEHARIRLEAQRVRPPRTRADAERPERRLGGHRLAIAGAGLSLVQRLVAQLVQGARVLNTARARPTDPHVAAYTAAVNLLAWHRSLEAAEALLDQLRTRKLPEWPTRALKAALTRSPNAALVDGLLRSIEEPGEPRGVAAAAEILGWRREPNAVQPLMALLSISHSPQVRKQAVVALGRIGERAAVNALVPLLDEVSLGEELAVALLLLGDRRGVDFHGQALASGLELVCPPGEIVGRYGGPSYLLLLMRTAEGSGARAMGALQGLGYLGDPRSVPVLLGALTHRSQDLVAVAASALELLTGHREDLDQPGLAVRWERWWEVGQCDFAEGVRYRYGRVLELAVLVEKLGDDDLLVRRGSYDELVISTGCRLPFDADGPWRVQLAHRSAWQEWVVRNRADFPPGRWYYDSDLIG